MSEDDQQKLIDLGKGVSYGQLLKSIKDRLESMKKEQDEDNMKISDKSVNYEAQSTSRFVLSILDIQMMKGTIDTFPMDLALNDRSVYKFSKLHMLTLQNPSTVYDIRFIMPLIFHAVSPSQFVDCRDFIAKRCLALTLTGLSSDDPQYRSLCYKTLERFYEHLSSALLIDKQLWLNFLDLIRNSIPASNSKLKFIFTTFLVRIIDVILHAGDDKLVELVKEFLAGRPRLKIHTIEIYDDLIMSSDVETYNHNLRWIMTLFRDGLMSQNDLKVAVNLKLIPHAMCLYNSALRFDRANEAIMSIFIKIAYIESGARLLVDEYSFLPWLHHTILFHLQKDDEEQMSDPKSESFLDTTKSISSLVFTLIDGLIKVEKRTLSLPRLLELITVFITLHSLIIKSKDCSVLGYYIDYVRIVVKAIRKNKIISDKLATQLLELVRAKIPYLA